MIVTMEFQSARKTIEFKGNTVGELIQQIIETNDPFDLGDDPTRISLSLYISGDALTFQSPISDIADDVLMISINPLV